VHDFAETPVVSDMPRERVPTGESLVVLTRDAALVETLKILGSEHNLIAVAAEPDLAGELVGKQTGVAIIDAAAASSAVARLTEQLKAQFPDLVLIVAGKLDDQRALAAQITHGTVYRFLHKPVSEQRVKLFVNAAWRRHGEELSGGADPLSATGVMPDDRAPLPRSTLLIGGAVLSALVIAGGLLMPRKPATVPVSKVASPSVPAVASDEQLESLLGRAEAALAAGALVAPPDQNAADLYGQALHRNAGDPRPAAGIEKVIDALLSAAEEQLGAQHLAEAQRLTDQARAIKPDHIRVAFLSARIGKERERRVLTRARQAATSGNLEQAIAVLDGAGTQQEHPTPVTEAPQELEHAAEVREALATGNAETAQHRVGAAAESGEAKAAVRREDFQGARAVGQDMPTLQDTPKRAADTVSVGNLELAKYVPPTFPVIARERGTSGWVDVQFVVTPTGLVSDVIITGAEPVGLFEQAAVNAVKKWRYKPVERDGHAVDQRVRLRIKFALDK
jgi:TonB family protein